MPVHIEELTNEVTVADGEMPLNPAQVEKIVQLVLARLEERKRQSQHHSESTAIRSEASPTGRNFS